MNEALGPDALLLRGRATAREAELLALVSELETVSPFRHWGTRSGGTMSVEMTNAGAQGWVSDRRGYRYDRVDPLTGAAWPAMPPAFLSLAREAAAAAGFVAFAPDCCLVNRYRPGAALSLHRDRDERDRTSPIVSVSLGAPATFLWEATEGATPRRIALAPGDVVVFGGASRFVRHGIARLGVRADVRTNLTFRATGLA